jgi:DnaD/phage-associated family protein
MGGLDGEELRQALDKACQRGIFLPLILEREGKRFHLYFLNMPPDKEAKERIERGEIALGEVVPEKELPLPQEKSIFSLYEENIGIISPLIAEELKEAEKLYPASWIEEAFREAVALNKRSWRYIARILERWARDGKAGRHIKKETDRKRYFKGKYGHLVGH